MDYYKRAVRDWDVAEGGRGITVAQTPQFQEGAAGKASVRPSPHSVESANSLRHVPAGPGWVRFPGMKSSLLATLVKQVDRLKSAALVYVAAALTTARS